MVCEICRMRISKSYNGKIHLSGSIPIQLKLCFSHDLELFKIGQVSFIKRYDGIISLKAIETEGDSTNFQF